ncbi:MAG: sugar ABC transporter permease [Clostridia bacterium]|nr:sugar ABC transporter permease [Clostridia bacterium]
MQATAVTPGGSAKRRGIALLVIGLILLCLGLSGLISLQGKSVRFDKAFDAKADLSAFFFTKLEEGQSYSFFQNLWIYLARYRLFVIIAGILCIAGFVALNRELLYSQKVAPYVFVAPFIITFLVFFTYPLISTILMSFQEITGAGSRWIGFKNYTDMFANKNFYTAVRNSFVYMVLTCAILIPVPMLLAYMTESKLSKVSGFFKTVAFMPVLCSVVVAGIIFRMMFSELDGAMMNQVRKFLGLKPIIWLKTSGGSMFAMVLLCFWRWTGMNMLYYMAGLKSISSELYEAADIDGANSVQKFTKICLPLLKPTTIYVLTISIYAGLAMFTESYMIFGGNNSPKNYGLTIVGYLYRYGFEKVDKFGFASAVGLVLLVGAMIITVIQLRITGVIGKKGDD